MRDTNSKNNEYAVKLRELRKYKSLKQAYVAKELNISRSFLSKIENGKAILSVALFIEYCKILDLEIECVINATI